MNKIEKGDIVARKSYGKDILFNVKRIVKTNKGDIALLSGVIERIEADSKLADLEKIDSKIAKKNIKEIEEKMNKRIEEYKKDEYKIAIIAQEEKRIQRKVVTGKILHLDGDKKYSEKSYYYYKKLGLNAVVKNIPEYKQPKVIYRLLTQYNPDILVITGHDGMIKRGTNYNDIYNYRNSRHFIQTVKGSENIWWKAWK